MHECCTLWSPAESGPRLYGVGWPVIAVTKTLFGSAFNDLRNAISSPTLVSIPVEVSLDTHPWRLDTAPVLGGGANEPPIWQRCPNSLQRNDLAGPYMSDAVGSKSGDSSGTEQSSSLV